MAKIDFTDFSPETMIRDNLTIIQNHLKTIFLAERMSMSYGAKQEDIDAFIVDEAREIQHRILSLSESELRKELHDELRRHGIEPVPEE